MSFTCTRDPSLSLLLLQYHAHSSNHAVYRSFTKVLQVNSLLFFSILSLPISYSQRNNHASYFITKAVQVNSLHFTLCPPPLPLCYLSVFSLSSLPPYSSPFFSLSLTQWLFVLQLTTCYRRHSSSGFH